MFILIRDCVLVACHISKNIDWPIGWFMCLIHVFWLQESIQSSLSWCDRGRLDGSSLGCSRGEYWQWIILWQSGVVHISNSHNIILIQKLRCPCNWERCHSATLESLERERVNCYPFLKKKNYTFPVLIW